MNEITNETLLRIHNDYVPKLNYTHEYHNKRVICYSGLSGSGKTTISQAIETKYHAMRYSSDEVRNVISGLKLASEFSDIHQISRKYLRWFLSNYDFTNGLIILDNDISSKYEEIYEILNPRGWNFFVIQISIDADTAKERVKKREKDFQGFFDNVQKRILEYVYFNKTHKADFIINNQEQMDCTQLFKTIDLFIL